MDEQDKNQIQESEMKRKDAVYQALKHLNKSIQLQEKTRQAFKSKLIAEARTESEKAREILEGLL